MKPLKKFAVLVEVHLDEILSYCEKKVPLGYLDSSNQKAKNVIRRAYGYRMTLPGDLQSLFPYFHACINFLFRFFDREV